MAYPYSTQEECDQDDSNWRVFKHFTEQAQVWGDHAFMFACLGAAELAGESARIAVQWARFAESRGRELGFI